MICLHHLYFFSTDEEGPMQQKSGVIVQVDEALDCPDCWGVHDVLTNERLQAFGDELKELTHTQYAKLVKELRRCI